MTQKLTKEQILGLMDILGTFGRVFSQWYTSKKIEPFKFQLAIKPLTGYFERLLQEASEQAVREYTKVIGDYEIMLFDFKLIANILEQTGYTDSELYRSIVKRISKLEGDAVISSN